MADTLAFEGIGSLAAKIRQGGVSPVALTEELLARIDALDPRLHAFIALTRERALGQARAAESALRARPGPGPAARHSLRGEGSLRRGRAADDGGHARAQGQRGGRRLRRRAPAVRGGHGARGQDAHGAVRLRRRRHQPRPRHPAQSVAPGASRAGRIEQRLGRGGGGRPRADGPRHRHGRVGQDPRRALRHRRAQDHRRAHQPRGRLPAELHARQRRAAHAVGRGRGAGLPGPPGAGLRRRDDGGRAASRRAGRPEARREGPADRVRRDGLLRRRRRRDRQGRAAGGPGVPRARRPRRQHGRARRSRRRWPSSGARSWWRRRRSR